MSSDIPGSNPPEKLRKTTPLVLTLVCKESRECKKVNDGTAEPWTTTTPNGLGGTSLINTHGLGDIHAIDETGLALKVIVVNAANFAPHNIEFKRDDDRIIPASIIDIVAVGTETVAVVTWISGREEMGEYTWYHERGTVALPNIEPVSNLLTYIDYSFAKEAYEKAAREAVECLLTKNDLAPAVVTPLRLAVYEQPLDHLESHQRKTAEDTLRVAGLRPEHILSQVDKRTFEVIVEYIKEHGLPTPSNLDAHRTATLEAVHTKIHAHHLDPDMVALKVQTILRTFIFRSLASESPALAGTEDGFEALANQAKDQAVEAQAKTTGDNTFELIADEYHRIVYEAVIEYIQENGLPPEYPVGLR